MSPRIAVLLVVAAAIAFGAFGYLYGVRTGEPDAAQISAAVDKYLDANPKQLAGSSATPTADATPAANATTADTPLDESQIAAVQGIIRDHLVANPEIVRDAINELQRKEFEAEVAAQASSISDEKDAIFNSSRQVVLGNPEGKVTLVEFFDYNCGYCKRAHADMRRLIEEDPELRVVLKEFPVLGEGSVEAAHVSVAVNVMAPEKYSDFHDALLLERGSVNGDRALAVAEEMGLDTEKLRALIPSDEVKATIEESYAIAEKLSLTGTPSYVTEKEVVIGAVGYDTLKTKIDEARN